LRPCSPDSRPLMSQKAFAAACSTAVQLAHTLRKVPCPCPKERAPRTVALILTKGGAGTHAGVHAAPRTEALHAGTSCAAPLGSMHPDSSKEVSNYSALVDDLHRSATLLLRNAVRTHALSNTVLSTSPQPGARLVTDACKHCPWHSNAARCKACHRRL